jgi:PEP-CTERM motif
MPYLRKALALGALALTAVSSRATAQTINFDDLNPAVDFLTVPVPYNGLGWNYGGGVTLVGPLSYVHQNEAYPCRSGLNCAINSHLSTIVVKTLTDAVTDKFTFTAWLAGSGLLNRFGANAVRARGYSGGSTTADFTMDFSLTGAAWIPVDFTGHLFNTLIFTPVDANGNEFTFDPFALDAGALLLDDMTVSHTLSQPPTPSLVPEPSAVLLMAFGLGAMAMASRRRSRAVA